jgi:hypothetical protein
MASAAVPRRAAALAGLAVALTAGASGGLVAAELEHQLTPPIPVSSVEPGDAAPPAPQHAGPGQQPHTTTRAS